ncbi:MAG: SH3 domain-containing protein, partial [Lachnospiraceae bacterium]|nr:SH3 domain-containing protein [Lachnospiraceae bacterium]
SADEAETTVSSESEAAEETPQESSEESYSAYITGDEVNVREEPTTDGGDDNVMFTLLEGDEVTVIEKQEGWVKISVNGKTGWMSSSYVERDE